MHVPPAVFDAVCDAVLPAGMPGDDQSVVYGHGTAVNRQRR